MRIVSVLLLLLRVAGTLCNSAAGAKKLQVVAFYMESVDSPGAFKLKSNWASFLHLPLSPRGI